MAKRERTRWPLAAFLAGFYVGWVAWCVLLIRYPDPLERGDVRALARLLLWIVPTLLYVRLVERRPLLESLGLKRHIGRGLCWGAVAILHPAAVAWYRISAGEARFQFPDDAATWLNPVLGAPVAEELLFRGVIFQRLKRAVGTAWGVVGSAALFALVHFPYWYLSGMKAGWGLAAAEGEMFAYGMAFAVLFRLTGSLWAPLVYHLGNNLLAVSLRPPLSD